MGRCGCAKVGEVGVNRMFITSLAKGVGVRGGQGELGTRLGGTELHG